MTHERTLIRREAAARLTGLATTGSRVYPGRTRSLGDSYQPSLLIYTVEEIVGRNADDNPAARGRNLQLIVDGRIMAAEPPDDDLDRIEAEVDAVLMADTTLGGLVFDLELVRVDTAMKAEGKHHEGSIRLEYRVRYWRAGDDE